MPNCGYNLPKFRVVVCFLTRFAVALKTAAKRPEKLGFQESTPRYSEVIQPQVRKKEACEKLSSVETKTRKKRSRPAAPGGTVIDFRSGSKSSYSIPQSESGSNAGFDGGDGPARLLNYRTRTAIFANPGCCAFRKFTRSCRQVR